MWEKALFVDIILPDGIDELIMVLMNLCCNVLMVYFLNLAVHLYLCSDIRVYSSINKSTGQFPLMSQETNPDNPRR